MTTIIETTDAAANTSTAYVMSTGDQFFGSLDPLTSDWVAVTLTAGQVYSFGAVGLGADRSGMTDPMLIMHDAAGAVLVSDNNDGPGKSAAITLTAATSGTYFIEVSSPTDTITGDYGLVVSAGDRPSYGVEMGAAILYRYGLTWSDGAGVAATLTWAVRADGPAFDATGADAPFSQLTAAQIVAAETALANFSEVCNLTFVQQNPGGTSNDATILMGGYESTTDGAGAFAYFPDHPKPGSVSGDLWLNDTYVSGTDLPYGSYSFFVMLHELGHAMGLAHPGDYNAAPGVTITYANSAQFVQDSEQYSVMSYFDAIDTQAGAPTTFADTLMMYDIYALQQMYGINHATRAGASVYGFNSNVGGAFDFTTNTDPLVCIWDGGGLDTLDLSGFAARQRIDLRDGTLSDVGGFFGNLSIAIGAVIENAVGGSKADAITGNAADNRLAGGKGNDTLTGDVGNDSLTGSGGADMFVFAGTSGHDRITDFNTAADFLVLSADLWGGAALSAAQVLDSFGLIVKGHLVLDFGLAEIAFKGLADDSGLASQILFS